MLTKERLERPLVIREISKRFDDVEALNRITFELNPGEIFGLLGPNGAGKTTLVSILTGLLSKSAGKASIFGYDIVTDSLKARSLVGVVPQETISHGFFSVEQVLKFHSGYYGIANNQKRIDYLLDKLALANHRKKKVSQLSGGMKRRLLIAKSLVHSPPLLLLDEPTAGVDVELRNTLWDFVRELNRDGLTVLLTTHYLQEAEELCNRIGVLNEGKLIALDQTNNLIQQLTQRQVKLTLTKPWIHQNNTPAKIEVNNNIIKASLSHNENVGAFIKDHGIPPELIQDVSINEGRLEDAFVKLIHQNNQG